MIKIAIAWIGFLALFSSPAPAQGVTSETTANFLLLNLSPATIKQGQTLTVFVESANPLKRLSIEAFGQKHTVYRVWHKAHNILYRVFLGVKVNQKPGTYKIIAKAVDNRNEPLEIYANLEVRAGNYKVQRIQLPKKKRKLLNGNALREEGKILGSRFREKDKKVYFASHFLVPVNGRLSSHFGSRRQYNGDEFSSFHKGIDIAKPRGTSVKAANGGRVSLVAPMKSNGKIILINHGHGVTSIYSHLNAFLVKEGDWVKKGEVIAKVGSTGISSGPHLHFGISVNNVRVDPRQWLKKKVVLYYNAD